MWKLLSAALATRRIIEKASKSLSQIKLVLNSKHIPRNKIRFLSFSLLFALSLAIPGTALSQIVTTTTVFSGGQIISSTQVNDGFHVYIGQYTDNSYYATNLGSGQTYATASGSASEIINNAIKLVNSQKGGGIVEIGPGSFLLTTSIVPLSNVYLKLSPYSTIYQNPPSSLGASISLLQAKSNVQDCTVDGGVWIGNKGGLTDHRNSGTWNANFAKYFGISFYGWVFHNIVVKNVLLKDVIGQGIDLRGAFNSLVSNCTVINAGDNPITIEGDDIAYNTIVEYSTVIGGQDVGINTFHANNVTIRYNTVTAVTQFGGASHWGIAAENSDSVNILNNHVTACEDAIASTSNNVLIANNIVDGKNAIGIKAGIHILDAQNNIVENNTISNFLLPLATYLNTQTINVLFKDNTVLNSNSVLIAGKEVTISGGYIESDNYNGAICLVSAINVNIIGVTLSGYKGITDYGQNTQYIRILNNDFSKITGQKTSLAASSQIYQKGNIGLADAGTDPL